MIGTRLGDYQLEEMLGRGGMGEVHRAHDTRRDRRVALKLLSEHLAHNPEYRERFRRESHVAARLQEPHVIPIHDYGEIEGRLFIDMRLVNGTDLSKVLEQTGPLAPGRAVDIVSQLAQALDAAHSDGLVHRDVKPANVLVTDNGDFVYLVDFGVAHAAGSMQLSLTATGNPIGTPNYMAPERFDNKPADRRVDIYALGCLLYECLTATCPYARDSIPALMKAHLYDPPPKPSALRAGIPTALDDVVTRAMAKDPDDRYATAGELAAAARNALTTSSAEPDPNETRSAETVRADYSPPTPPLTSLPSPDIPPLQRRGHRVVLVLALVLGAAILAAGTALTVWVTNRSTDAPNTNPSSAPPSRILTSEHTAASLFGAEPRNGTCNPVTPSQYRRTANDIEVLECPDLNSQYTRYFVKYSGLDHNGWVAKVRSGTAYRDFTFVRADSCFDIYTATYMDTDRKLNNTAIYVFRKAPFVVEVVAPVGVADLNTLANVDVYSTNNTALC
ncbi:MAG: serine/threonine-protein kinase [Pseudonocardiaceae bacterium]